MIRIDQQELVLAVAAQAVRIAHLESELKAAAGVIETLRKEKALEESPEPLRSELRHQAKAKRAAAAVAAKAGTAP